MFQCFPELVDEFIQLEGVAVIDLWLDNKNEKITVKAKLFYDTYMLGSKIFLLANTVWVFRVVIDSETYEEE